MNLSIPGGSFKDILRIFYSLKNLWLVFWKVVDNTIHRLPYIMPHTVQCQITDIGSFYRPFFRKPALTNTTFPSYLWNFHQRYWNTQIKLRCKVFRKTPCFWSDINFNPSSHVHFFGDVKIYPSITERTFVGRGENDQISYRLVLSMSLAWVQKNDIIQVFGSFFSKVLFRNYPLENDK